MENFAEFLNKWQTLVAGLLALFAGLITVAMMWKQLNDSRQKNKDEMARKKLAATAEIPDSLSNMCRYIRDCAKFLLGDIDEKSQIYSPNEAVSILKLAIQHIDQLEAQQVLRLCQWYQVQRARLFEDRDFTQEDVAQLLLDLSKLQAYVNRLFDYAQDIDKNEVFKKQELRSALQNAVSLKRYSLTDDKLKRVVERIDAVYK